MSDSNNTPGRAGPGTADILAIQGSPRRGGNTDLLLDAALESAGRLGATYEKIVLRDFKISPCLEINQCMKTGHCAIKDDMTGLYSKLTAAPVVLAATPIFFYGPSAQLKTFIDRCQALWARKYILKQSPGPRRARGYLISAGATGGKKTVRRTFNDHQVFFSTFWKSNWPENCWSGAWTRPERSWTRPKPWNGPGPWAGKWPNSSKTVIHKPQNIQGDEYA